MEIKHWIILGLVILLIILILFYFLVFHYAIPLLIDGMQNDPKIETDEEKKAKLKRKFESRLLIKAYNESDAIIGKTAFRKLSPRFSLNYDHSCFGYFNSFKAKPEELCFSSCEIYSHFFYMEKNNEILHKNYLYLWDGVNSITPTQEIQVVLLTLNDEKNWIMSVYQYERWSLKTPPKGNHTQVVIKIPMELYEPD